MVNMVELFNLAGIHPAIALPLLFLSLALAVTTLRCLYNIYLHPLRHYPGPKLWAATGIPYTLAFLSGRISDRVSELHSRYGDIVRIGPSRLSYTDPSAWRDIRGHRKAGEAENAKEESFYASARHNIVGASRQDHTRFRRVLAHGFSAQAMHRQEPLITRYVDLLITRLRAIAASSEDGVVDIVSWMNYTTFDIIGDLSFGVPFGCLEQSAMHPWVSSIFNSVADFPRVVSLRRYAPRLFAAIRTAFPRWIGKSQADQAAYAEAQVSKRLALPTERHDFVDAMAGAHAEKAMSREEIVENARIMVLAGSETTATVLSAVVYLLCGDGRVRERLVGEIRETFRGEEEIDFAGVQRLKYIGAVLDESMRVVPPVPGNFPRVAQRGGVSVCGRVVPEGTALDIWPWAMFRSARNFADPLNFVPERWLDGPEREERFAGDRKEALQPFSYGPRNCIGKNLAYVEMRLILARLMWNFDIDFANEEGKNWVDGLLGFNLWNKPALRVKLTPRSIRV